MSWYLRFLNLTFFLLFFLFFFFFFFLFFFFFFFFLFRRLLAPLEELDELSLPLSLLSLLLLLLVLLLLLSLLSLLSLSLSLLLSLPLSLLLGSEGSDSGSSAGFPFGFSRSFPSATSSGFTCRGSGGGLGGGLPPFPLALTLGGGSGTSTGSSSLSVEELGSWPIGSPGKSIAGLGGGAIVTLSCSTRGGMSGSTRRLLRLCVRFFAFPSLPSPLGCELADAAADGANIGACISDGGGVELAGGAGGFAFTPRGSSPLLDGLALDFLASVAHNERLSRFCLIVDRRRMHICCARSPSLPEFRSKVSPNCSASCVSESTYVSSPFIYRVSSTIKSMSDWCGTESTLRSASPSGVCSCTSSSFSSTSSSSASVPAYPLSTVQFRRLA